MKTDKAKNTKLARQAKSGKAEPIVFRPDKVTDEIIMAARRVTGATQTLLLERCCQKAMSEVVREILEEQDRAKDEYMKFFEK